MISFSLDFCYFGGELHLKSLGFIFTFCVMVHLKDAVIFSNNVMNIGGLCNEYIFYVYIVDNSGIVLYDFLYSFINRVFFFLLYKWNHIFWNSGTYSINFHYQLHVELNYLFRSCFLINHWGTFVFGLQSKCVCGCQYVYIV
jgi:hypothetical protein